MDQQLDRIFASMNFEGEGIDPELMARVMEKMRSDLASEVGGGAEQTSVSEVDTESPLGNNVPTPIPPPTTANNTLSTLPHPPNETSTVRISLLRFDGVKETQDFSIEINNINDSASTFLESVLSLKNLNNGISRMDRGSPDSISAATLIQPMWKSMREVLSEMNNDSTSSDKITIHWYPNPPMNNNDNNNNNTNNNNSSVENNFYGGGDTGLKANWVRVITITRRSVFVLFDEEKTTLLSFKRNVEALTGIAIEWQRLLFGSKLLQSDNSDIQSEENILVSSFGVKGGMNVFLTHRIEGMEYGGDGAALS